MPNATGSIQGPNSKNKVAFYGLSTCIWCKKTRQFLEDEGVAFDYVYVDLLRGEQREEAKEQIRLWNPSVSFPTIVIDDDRSVVGYKPDKLKEELDL